MQGLVLKTLSGLFVAVVFYGSALAHHGWNWTTGGNIEVTGYIKSLDLGFPHGVVKLDVEGEVWTVEVGQPWRNERAGLKKGDLAIGVELKVQGQPSADIEDKRVKAERLYIKGVLYNLYPDRD